VLREELKSGVGVLGAIINGKGSFVCVVTKDLITGKKLNAGDIIHQVAKLAGGGGGGNPYMALAGARDVSKIDEALIAVEHIVRKMIENY
ncbi:MAG: DHHA1 domain-containing protein, partial [bacterium]